MALYNNKFAIPSSGPTCHRLSRHSASSASGFHTESSVRTQSSVQMGIMNLVAFTLRNAGWSVQTPTFPSKFWPINSTFSGGNCILPQRYRRGTSNVLPGRLVGGQVDPSDLVLRNEAGQVEGLSVEKTLRTYLDKCLNCHGIESYKMVSLGRVGYGSISSCTIQCVNPDYLALPPLSPLFWIIEENVP